MQPVTDARASGNAEVVDLLERWLKQAQQGRLRYAALVTCESPMHVDVEHAGSAGCEFAANYGLDLLKQHVFGNKRAGGISGLDASYVCYDLGRAPIGWDFASWLIEQEQTRVRLGAPAPLKVAFKGDVSRRKWGATETQMVEHVMRPLLDLLGAVEDVRALQAPVTKEFYMLRYVTDAARQGEPVPKFKPKSGSMHGGVVITLREAGHWPHRNSNIAAWSKFAHELRRRGEQVIFVRDTAKAAEPFEDFITLPDAATDIGVRTALYAGAKCNLFVSNGPWWLALFGDRPWLAFNAVSADDPFDANKPAMWKDFHGVGVGEQFPWQRDDQRIIWEADDYDVLIKAWEELAPALELQAKAA